jgi:hypothetical protein
LDHSQLLSHAVSVPFFKWAPGVGWDGNDGTGKKPIWIESIGVGEEVGATMEGVVRDSDLLRSGSNRESMRGKRLTI